MAFNPIFPPSERNYSSQELAEAAEILDPETRQNLAMDRARLLQATSAAVIAFCRQLGLSKEATKEISIAIIDSSKELSPSYHEFVNKLLSTIVEVNHIDEISNVPEIENTEFTPVVETPLSEYVVPEYAGPVIEIPADMKLFPHDEISSRPMKKFLGAIIDPLLLDIDKLSLDEVSLMSWQALDFYNRFKMPFLGADRKATQIKRVAKHIGLYEEPMTFKEMGSGSEDAGSQSIGLMYKRVKEKLHEHIGPNVMMFLARAHKTLKEIPPSELFSSAEERLNVTAIKEFGSNDEQPASQLRDAAANG